MLCPRCGIEMDNGHAIRPNTEHDALYIVPPPLINTDTLRIILCYKCPECGHSEEKE